MIAVVKGLSKWFGDLEVLRDITFEIEKGEQIALLGPSGCGKTTLLRILLGLECANGGSVESRLSRAGYLPQDALLFPWKTVVENVELPLQIAGVARSTRRRAVADRLPRFGLSGFEDAYPHELSGGMKQRAALLRAVMTGAESLVLDEPFGALDTLTRHRLQGWLSDLASELASTLVFVTHDLEEAIVLAERIVVLTERPASVLGVCSVRLTPAEREDRLGPAFAGAKDGAMRLILQGVPDEARQPI